MKILIVAETPPKTLLESLKTTHPNGEFQVVAPSQAYAIYTRWCPEWVVAPAAWMEAWLKQSTDPSLLRALPRLHLRAKTQSGIQLLPVDAIIYFQAEDKHVIAHHQDGNFLIEEALMYLEQEFSGQFIRVHRKLLVAKKAIVGLEKDEPTGRILISLKGLKNKLPVSRRQVPSLRRFLKSL